jgi:hypothetical protein
VHDPIVVYAMVTALIAALAVGIFFATPLRRLLTGPDEPAEPIPVEGLPEEPPEEPPEPREPPVDGPWSTAPPTPDQNWTGPRA